MFVDIADDTQTRARRRLTTLCRTTQKRQRRASLVVDFPGVLHRCHCCRRNKTRNASNAIATSTDFLVRNVVRVVLDYLVHGSDGRLLADRQKTSSEEIGKNEHAHSVRFPRTRFLNLERLGDVGPHLGRENRCV